MSNLQELIPPKILAQGRRSSLASPTSSTSYPTSSTRKPLPRSSLSPEPSSASNSTAYTQPHPVSPSTPSPPPQGAPSSSSSSSNSAGSTNSTGNYEQASNGSTISNSSDSGEGGSGLTPSPPPHALPMSCLPPLAQDSLTVQVIIVTSCCTGSKSGAGLRRAHTHTRRSRVLEQ
jgi:hypothetical protein